jgi:hypothetical protein
VAAVVLTTAFYPSISKNAASFEKLLGSLPEGLRKAFGEDFASPAGYLQARLFSIFAPVLLLIYAIGAGSRAIAGEEERQTLDLLLSTPAPRRRVVLDKALAMVAASAGLGAVLGLAIVLTGPPYRHLGRHHERRGGGRRLRAAGARVRGRRARRGGGHRTAFGGRRRHGRAAAASYLIDILARR